MDKELEKKDDIKEATETKEETKETESKKAKKPKNPWEETVEITLPKASKTEQNFQFVSVNGRTFQVPKGKTVKVPKPVYEVLMNSRYAEEKAEKYEEELKN